MNAWCDENLITFTPAFYVNGFQLPEIYSTEDLGHLIMRDQLKHEKV